jgi:hypothetical protein
MKQCKPEMLEYPPACVRVTNSGLRKELLEVSKSRTLWTAGHGDLRA